jgi:tol-pal system protein YbgF
MLSSLVFLTGCPNPGQEKSLVQIRSQLTVLSTEMRDSFQQSEVERVSLYKDLNEDMTALQQNQADITSVNDDLTMALTAIEAKVDEYNTRMEQLQQRLTVVETTLVERMTLLSEQINEIGRENAISVVPAQQAPAQSTQPVTETVPTASPIPQVVTPPRTDSNPEAGQLYQQAYMAYVNGNFDDAISGFERYLDLYSEMERADLAQYWIAESFFSLGEFETALQEYDTLITHHPDSDRIAAAYFSKADAYLKLDRQIEAMSHLRYIISQFPNTTAAQRAQERLRSLEP